MVQKRVTAKKVPGNSSAIPAEVTASGEGNVDKIRDILFGSQMKDYESKFQRLEERLSKEISRNKDDLNKRIDTLENYIKKELVSINERLKQEKSLRTDAIKELSSEHKKSSKVVDKNISALEDQLETVTQDLRMQILEQSKSLSDEIADKHQQSDKTTEQMASELRADKIDKTSLSEMFTEIAIRLADADTDYRH